MYSDFIESPSKGCFSFNDQFSHYDMMTEMNEISNQTDLDYIIDSLYSSVSRCSTGFELPEDCTNMSFSELFDQELLNSYENKDCKITIKIEKEEPLINPCYSNYDSQDPTNNCNSPKSDKNIYSSFSPLKSFTPKPGINRNSTKYIKNYDIDNLTNNPFCEKKDIVTTQTLVKTETPVIKCEPVDDFDPFEQNIDTKVKSCYFTKDTHNSIDDYSLIKTEESASSSSSLSKNSSQKHCGINKTSIKTSKYCGNHRMYKSFCETENLNVNQKLIKIETPIVKHEPEDTDDSVKQNIVGMKVKSNYSFEESLSAFNSYNLVKVTNKVSSSLPKKSYQGNNKNTRIGNVQHPTHNYSCKPKNINDGQMSVKAKTFFVKQEHEDFNKTAKKRVNGTNIKSYSSISQNVNSHCLVNTKNNVSSSSKTFITKSQKTYETSLKAIENYDDKHIAYNSIDKTENLCFDQNSVEIKTLVIKSEPDDTYYDIEHNIVDMELETNENEENTNNVILNDFHCVDLNNIKKENQEVIIIKNNTVPNITFKKKDFDSQTCLIQNEITSETEKKKISMEEYRAKRGTILKENLVETSENNDVIDITTYNGKLESIIEEFDRNTAEHFIGHKRKLEGNDQNTTVKDIRNNKEQELQEKRMKIEYIKKLLPSSFASEIAKTSSLMKGSFIEDFDSESISDDSITFNNNIEGKYTDTHSNLGYLKKDDKFLKKNQQVRIHSSLRVSSRSDYSNNNNRLPSTLSNSDDYYNRNRIDAPQQIGQYNQNLRNIVQRPKDQRKVVYVGQIPIRLGKRYLYNRFKKFGTIQSLTLHKKPDFRVYYAFVTYSESSEAERAISHGNDNETQVKLDIRFGERKQIQTPYYDLDDEWLTDWYGYNKPVVVRTKSPEKVSYEEELQEFYKLAQIKKLNQNSSQES